MLYSIINTEKGKAHGFNPALHNTIGDRMVVNENELRHVSDDIYEAARILGGDIMQPGEVMEELKKTGKTKRNNE